MSEVEVNVGLELFKQLHSEGADKNTIIRRLADDVLEGDITAAVREYNKHARALGLILSAKERTIKVNELLNSWIEDEDLDLTDDDVRQSLVDRIVDEFDIMRPTASQHVREYAVEAGIELPTINRTPFADILKFITEQRDEGIERKDTCKAMSEKFGITEDSADSAYSRAMKELGLSASRGAKCDIGVLVAAVREARAEFPGDKASAVAKVAEVTGYSIATTKQWFNMIPFAEAWTAAVAAESN